MTFQVNLTRYQVETASTQYASHIQQKAEDIYQEYVRENIPCEFYIDGMIQKEYKPPLS
jgi:hypothetical protein